MLTLSSMDIKNQEFKRSLRGFDESEVTAFLGSVATQWQEQQEELRRMEERVAELENKISHYQRIEEALQEAINTARSSSAAALEDAERRARLILQEAELSGRQITSNAIADNERLKSETGRLLEKQAEVVARLRAFLGSELELLERFGREQRVPQTAFQQPAPMRSEHPVSAPEPEYDQPLTDEGNDSTDAVNPDYQVDTQASEDEYVAEDLESPEPVQTLAERAPQARPHEWQPSIARSRVGAIKRDAGFRPDQSWPSDSEEVVNPNGHYDNPEWEGDVTEPGDVFASDGADSFAAEEPYNVSDDELEKIRRILDDLD